jgi:hypothetical protein
VKEGLAAKATGPFPNESESSDPADPYCEKLPSAFENLGTKIRRGMWTCAYIACIVCKPIHPFGFVCSTWPSCPFPALAVFKSVPSTASLPRRAKPLRSDAGRWEMNRMMGLNVKLNDFQLFVASARRAGLQDHRLTPLRGA